MTNVNAPRLARDLAREYLDEPDNASAEALGRRLARLARGRAILVDDQVLIPHPTGRLAILPVWDLDLEGVDVEGAAAELAALASGARPVVEPLLPVRVAFAREVTSCTIEEAWAIVDEMDRVGFRGEDGEFVSLAREILRRDRIRDDTFVKPGPTRVLDPRD